ncbi:MAG: hypothetical protein HY908_04750 [Myxococcales bacterium]|nr:hypothetical protein [Myxococcales bacterium]
MRALRKGLRACACLVFAGLAGCPVPTPAGSMVEPRVSATPQPAAPQPAAPQALARPEPCEVAAGYRRARAPELLRQGRLGRALRVLSRADELCPASRADSDGPRAAAQAAMDPAGLAGAELYRLAAQEGAAGHGPEAQRLRDRAIAALEHETGAPLSVELPIVEHPVGGPFAVSADGRSVAFGGRRSVHVLDLGSGRERLRFGAAASDTAGVGPVAISAGGERVAAVVDDGHVRVWDGRTGAPVADIVPTEMGEHVGFTSDATSLWLSTRNAWDGSELSRWDLASGQRTARVARTPVRGAWLVERDARGRMRATDVRTTLPAYPDTLAPPPVSLAWIDLDTARTAGVVRIPAATEAAALSADGHLVALESRDGFTGDVTVEVRSAESGAPVRRMESPPADAFGHAPVCLGLELSSDGRLLLASCETRARVWEVATGRLLRDCDVCSGPATFLGRQVVLPHRSRVWDPVTNTTRALEGGRVPLDAPENAGARVPALALEQLYAEASKRPVTTVQGTLVAWEYALPDGAALVTTPAGHVEVVGATTREPLCRFGAVTYPYDLCRERVSEPNLRQRALEGDPTLEEL